MISQLATLLDGETRDIETTIQAADGSSAVIGWRLRRPTSLTMGVLLPAGLDLVTLKAGEEAPPPESVAANAAKRLQTIMEGVCAAVVAVKLPGAEWAPVNLVIDGEADDATNTLPLSRIGMPRVMALMQAAMAFAQEGGDALNRFLHP